MFFYVLWLMVNYVTKEFEVNNVCALRTGVLHQIPVRVRLRDEK